MDFRARCMRDLSPLDAGSASSPPRLRCALFAPGIDWGDAPCQRSLTARTPSLPIFGSPDAHQNEAREPKPSFAHLAPASSPSAKTKGGTESPRSQHGFPSLSPARPRSNRRLVRVVTSAATPLLFISDIGGGDAFNLLILIQIICVSYRLTVRYANE